MSMDYEHEHEDRCMYMADSHPFDELLRDDRIPHIWCPGCGCGEIIAAYIEAVKELKIDNDTISIVSGIGCIGRAAGYLNFDSFHTTHGRAIPFATGLKVSRPELEVAVISGDGDLFAIGGNHIIHAARRNMDMLVICSNNHTYGMTGGQFSPATPVDAFTTTTPYGNCERPFNLCDLVTSAGASYVARWTSLHVRRLQKSVREALTKKGFRFIEVLTPCPTGYGRRNKMGTAIDTSKLYQEHGKINHGADTRDVRLDDPLDDFSIGTFVDLEKETYLEAKERIFSEEVKK
jgi:2-oxoglutarate ferredoxin oxidoreductase subunit beta